MIEYKTELKKILLLNNLEGLDEHLKVVTQAMSAKDLAHFFVDTIFLNSVVHIIIDDHWIQSQNSQSEIYFDKFVKKFLTSELKSMLFLHAYFSESSLEGMKTAAKALDKSEKFLLKIIKSKPAEYQKTFLQITLQLMSELFELEHQINSARKKDDTAARLSLYRSFDALDQIFELNYLLNEVADVNQKERLYEGAGVGVQSSYATTLLALRYLNLTKGSRFIDLGSGYGRIGLVVGLMRPDIHFTGYEFVKERVDIANQASRNLHLSEHVKYVTQDLAQPEFKIPVADTYYIFDSFTPESYAFIMPQLQEITLQRKVTVVTKGNAKLWMNNKFWTEPQEFNGGNLCLFRSRARPR